MTDQSTPPGLGVEATPDVKAQSTRAAPAIARQLVESKGAIYGYVGLALTIAYSLFIWWLFEDRWDRFRDLDFDKASDFLGGVFGPLAFLWLVLGFFQQGVELRQNSRALHLQAEELKNSVEAQREIAAVAKEELKATLTAMDHERARLEQERVESERASQPAFRFIQGWKSSGSNSETWQILLRNAGADASDITVEFLPADPANMRSQKIRHSVLARGQQLEIVFGGPGQARPRGEVEVSYTDVKSSERMALFDLFYNSNEDHISIQAKPTFIDGSR